MWCALIERQTLCVSGIPTLRVLAEQRPRQTCKFVLNYLLEGDDVHASVCLSVRPYVRELQKSCGLCFVQILKVVWCLATRNIRLHFVAHDDPRLWFSDFSTMHNWMPSVGNWVHTSSHALARWRQSAVLSSMVSLPWCWLVTRLCDSLVWSVGLTLCLPWPHAGPQICRICLPNSLPGQMAWKATWTRL